MLSFDEAKQAIKDGVICDAKTIIAFNLEQNTRTLAPNYQLGWV